MYYMHICMFVHSKKVASREFKAVNKASIMDPSLMKDTGGYDQLFYCFYVPTRLLLFLLRRQYKDMYMCIYIYLCI